MYDIVFKYDKSRNCIFISKQDKKVYSSLIGMRIEYDDVYVESDNVPELDDGILYVRGHYKDYDENAIIIGYPLFSEGIDFIKAIIALENNDIKVGVDFDNIPKRVDVDKCKSIVYALEFDANNGCDLLKCVCDYGGFKCLI